MQKRRDFIHQVYSCASIVTALFLSACSNGGSTSPSPLTDQPTYGSSQATGFQGESSSVPMSVRVQAAQQGSLFCNSSDACNPAVVLISTVTDQGVSRCSGVLISPNEVLTNDHCVDHSTAVETGASCDGQIFVHFAATEQVAAETFSCASVEFRSHESGTDSKDFSVIKLVQAVTDRDPVNVSKRGFNFHEAAKVFRVQMTTGQYGTFDGYQDVLNCVATYQTMLYPQIADATSPLMSFGNCPLVPGNSGAPAFNSNGELGAVVQGYYNFATRPDLATELRNLSWDNVPDMVAIGTQAECMENLNKETAAKCSAPQKAMGLGPNDYVMRYENDFVNRIQKPVPQPNTDWVRLPGSTASFVSFAQVPHCITKAEAGGISSLPLSVMKYRSGINESFEVEWRAETTDAITIPFAVTHLAATSVSLNGGGLSDVSIPFCK